MTIKEFYEWARENRCENYVLAYNIFNPDYNHLLDDGFIEVEDLKFDSEIDEESKTITLKIYYEE